MHSSLPLRARGQASTSGRSGPGHGRSVQHLPARQRALSARCRPHVGREGQRRCALVARALSDSPTTTEFTAIVEEAATLDATPHPSPPEDLKPADLAGGMTLADLALQVHQLRSLVQTQQDLIYSQKAKIEQLTETVQEEMHRGRPAPTVPPPATSSMDGMPPPPRAISPFAMQAVGYGDRRLAGLYDARFHSTHNGATPKDYRVLPDRIILVRHAESEGNVDNKAYSYIPDSQVPLTARGHMQAREAGQMIKQAMQSDPEARDNYRLFFYISPYKRSLQTYEGICSQFPSHHLLGVQEEVQLREQDFGNFQDHVGKQREKAERLRFGRFFYRFPNGESGADVYDRITIFEDHMIRDINAGRFADKTSLVLVTHGLALRVFLMRWFHWTVDEFLSVYNPGNAEPLVLERMRFSDDTSWRHTKSLYKLTDESMRALKGCTMEMCSTDHLPRSGLKVSTRLL